MVARKIALLLRTGCQGTQKNNCHENLNTCFTRLNGNLLNKILVAMENFEKCTVAMLGGPCSQHVTGNTSRLNHPQSAIMGYIWMALSVHSSICSSVTVLQFPLMHFRINCFGIDLKFGGYIRYSTPPAWLIFDHALLDSHCFLTSHLSSRSRALEDKLAVGCAKTCWANSLQVCACLISFWSCSVECQLWRALV